MKMNLIVKQQRDVMTISKIRRGILPKNTQAYSSYREAGSYSWLWEKISWRLQVDDCGHTPKTG